MKKNLAVFLLLLVFAIVFSVGCGADDNDKTDNTEVTKKAEPTQSENTETPTATESPATPTPTMTPTVAPTEEPTATPTEAPEEIKPSTVRGSVFTNFSDKKAEAIVANVLAMRTIDKSTTMDNYLDRFDMAPSNPSPQINGANYSWDPDIIGSVNCLREVMLASNVYENGVLDISTPDFAAGEGAVKAEGGGVVCVTIDLKDEALAKDLYARFVGIIGDDYVKVLGFSEDELKKEDDVHKDGEWSINYLANFVSLTWGLDDGEDTIYTLSINMLLRYAN